ncbi:MAG: response regulator [Ignavibacteria bacterium]|nr:response regulator [Ignavibacteria bacterium]
MTILIVEDNEQMRNFEKHILKSWGHTTIEADNGRTGVDAFVKNNPDVVLMDIKMGDTDGIEATRLIREISSTVKIIMVTDYDEKSLRKRANEAGANDYVLKENLLELKTRLIK